MKAFPSLYYWMNIKIQQIPLADQHIYKQIIRFANGEQNQYKFYHDMLTIQYKLLNHFMTEWPTIDNKPVDLYNLYHEFQKLGGFFEVYKKGASASHYNMKKQIYCPLYIKYLLLQEQIYLTNGVVNIQLIKFIKKFITRKESDAVKQPEAIYYPDLYIPPLASKIQHSEIQKKLNQQIKPLQSVPATSKPLFSYQLTKEDERIPTDYEVIAANVINEYIYTTSDDNIEFFLQLYKFLDEYSNATIFRSQLSQYIINYTNKLLIDQDISQNYYKGQIMAICVLILSKLNEMNASLFSVNTNSIHYNQYSISFELLNLVQKMDYSKNSIYAIILFLGSLIQSINFTNNYHIIKDLARNFDQLNCWLYNAILQSNDKKIQYAALSLLRCQIIILNNEQEGVNGYALEMCQSLIHEQNHNIDPDIKEYTKQVLQELWEGDIYPVY